MARVNGAGARSRAGAIQGMARSLAHPAYSRIVRAEPWLRRLVPALVLIFVFILGGFAILQTSASKIDALNDSAADLEMATSLARSEIARAVAENAIKGNKQQAALEPGVANRLIAKGRVLIFIDANGSITHTVPVNANLPLPIQDILAIIRRTDEPASDIPRAMRSADESVLVATARLANKRGLVALVQPIDRALAPWTERINAYLIMLASAGLVILGLGIAYFWQVWRSRETDTIMDKVRKRLDLALNRGRCGLWDWDVARGTIFWSDSMYDMLGYQREAEFLSFGDVNALVHPDDSDLYALADALAKQSAAAVDQTFRMRSQNGSWVWLRARCELIHDGINREPHLIGIAIDISEQKRLSDERAAHDQRLRDAIETIGESFVLWDAKNRLVMCNTKFQRLHNLPDEAVAPGTPYDVMKGFMTGPLFQSDRERKTDRPDEARSYEVKLPGGRWLQVDERRTRDGSFVSVGTDITALKMEEHRFIESERKLTQTISDLRRSRTALEAEIDQRRIVNERYLEQKLEAETANKAKSEFLAKMSHELRTPLNAILGFSEMMETEVLGPLGNKRYKAYTRDISKSGHNLLAIIADILDMAELEAGRIKIDRQPLSLKDVIEEEITPFRAEARRKHLKIVTDISEAATLIADRRGIGRILSHLLSNAIKFTPDSGKISVTLREVSGALNLYVEDTGIGIPKDALPQLARPFEWVELDAKKPTEGAGLGLAIARSFTELHGGTLSIRSTEGTGTSVIVRLPIREASTLDDAGDVAAA